MFFKIITTKLFDKNITINVKAKRRNPFPHNTNFVVTLIVFYTNLELHIHQRNQTFPA